MQLAISKNSAGDRENGYFKVQGFGRGLSCMLPEVLTSLAAFALKSNPFDLSMGPIIIHPLRAIHGWSSPDLARLLGVCDAHHPLPVLLLVQVAWKTGPGATGDCPSE